MSRALLNAGPGSMLLNDTVTIQLLSSQEIADMNPAISPTAKQQADSSAHSYKPEHPLRFVTAAGLFDGHDAAINIFRRLLQRHGAEVIHLGHNRAAEEVVDAAIQEDAQAIAVSSYQGGHMEYFRYMRELLDQKGAQHVKIFGGGGGVIVPDEIAILQKEGVERIYSPDDGRALGLDGIVFDMMRRSDFLCPAPKEAPAQSENGFGRWTTVARWISLVEREGEDSKAFREVTAILKDRPKGTLAPVVGLTGTGGAGKSCLTDEIVRRFLLDWKDRSVAVLSVDPSKRRTGGALLGDRLRMNAVHHERAYMRSLATRQSKGELSGAIRDAIAVAQAAGFDLVIVETSGIGQGDAGIVEVCDIPIYVMTSEFGAPTQLEKIEMLDYAKMVVVNKFDRRGSEDAFRDVCKQLRREQDIDPSTPIEELPVFGTMASRFNDEGVNAFYKALMVELAKLSEGKWDSTLEIPCRQQTDVKTHLIDPSRLRYLSEIAETLREHHQHTEQQVKAARRVDALQRALEEVGEEHGAALSAKLEEARAGLDPGIAAALDSFDELREAYQRDEMVVRIRDKEIRNQLNTRSLSGTPIARVVLPSTEDKGDQVRFLLEENVPGKWPYTAGVFPFKRPEEEPARMFAGEGPPEQTNLRFHYLSKDSKAKRLSTAFDSVTLYGEDPGHRPDIYGKVGESGVSICSLDDMKRLYSGFHLTDPSTSVSMTINGPAPMILAMFLNTAIDQECERWLKENGKFEEARARRDQILQERGAGSPSYHGELPSTHDGFGLDLLGVPGDQLLPPKEYARIKEHTLKIVRGTVQADILKEDQAQNTCIFSTDFALKMMGDIQQYFIDHKVRNYYSVSISGYHIAEAGANPISQLAFTLANGFTYVEHYLSRGMSIDEVAPNLSFFFSNGLDPEYTVIGRVARRIWAVAMKRLFHANERSQKLKYHIQTSGRSLHAREIAFNDIRTTLQALMALADNCNSLHTNAYDEAVTTPTEESVRRALAIQLIINRELGFMKNENILQGSYFVEQLTHLVEEAVLAEFDRLSDRGGVLGAMETQYQRGRIQEESLLYETKKHSGELPIIGVNSFLDPNKSENQLEAGQLIRASKEAKERQIDGCQRFQRRHQSEAKDALARLQRVAINGENVFEELMETVKVATLGQITHALYEVGGEYRRMV